MRLARGGLLPAPLVVLRSDAWLLLATRGPRLFAVGFFSVILNRYLAELGLELPVIDAIFTV